ncbi:MAG: hypothetical protein COB15_17490 [Flavobacteriales bacterium]|nr:MAG: hypothetical protein COB15_17490 [Flavobacteriales bacterium]
MKNKILLVLLILLSLSLHSQTFENVYRVQNKADSLIYIEKDTISFLNEIKAIPEQERFFSQELQLAKIFLKIGDTTNSLKHYLFAFKKGGGIDHIHSSLNPEHKKYLNKNYKQHHLLYMKNNDVSNEFLYKMYELLGNDQLIRVQNRNSIVDNQEFAKTDSLNLLVLMELIKSYGFPMQKAYGSHFHAFYILMIHLPYLNVEVYQQFVSFYKNNLLDGAITPDLLAYFIDRYDYAENGAQTYGSIADPYFGISKIKNAKDVDEKRSKLYLPSMRIWKARRGIK